MSLTHDVSHAYTPQYMSLTHAHRNTCHSHMHYACISHTIYMHILTYVYLNVNKYIHPHTHICTLHMYLHSLIHTCNDIVLSYAYIYISLTGTDVSTGKTIMPYEPPPSSPQESVSHIRETHSPYNRIFLCGFRMVCTDTPSLFSLTTCI